MGKEGTSTKARILVVDDDACILELLHELLATNGYSVESASDGIEAEKILLEKEVDLVITDLVMPGVNGLDLTRKIRFLHRECRIILITGHPKDADIVQCLLHNVSRFIRKPFTMAMFLQQVAEVLDEIHAQPIERIGNHVGGWLEMDLRATEVALIRAHHFVENYILEYVAPTDTAKRLAWSFYEMARNAMEWGNQLNESTTVRVGCLALSDRVLFKIQDQGNGFDVATAFNPTEDPFLRQELRNKMGKRPGGYGIEMARKYMDDLFYNEKGNCLIMTKYVKTTRDGF